MGRGAWCKAWGDYKDPGCAPQVNPKQCAQLLCSGQERTLHAMWGMHARRGCRNVGVDTGMHSGEERVRGAGGTQERVQGCMHKGMRSGKVQGCTKACTLG